MTVTDEMVEKAYASLLQDEPNPEGRERIRAMLEAVAPMLIAQGMREAAGICDDFVGEMADELEDAILARAQEIDPQ